MLFSCPFFSRWGSMDFQPEKISRREVVLSLVPEWITPDSCTTDCTKNKAHQLLSLQLPWIYAHLPDCVEGDDPDLFELVLSKLAQDNITNDQKTVASCSQNDLSDNNGRSWSCVHSHNVHYARWSTYKICRRCINLRTLGTSFFCLCCQRRESVREARWWLRYKCLIEWCYVLWISSNRGLRRRWLCRNWLCEW